MKNISFWSFINDGYVKIKLRPGQVLNWHKRSWDEEGGSWRGETWEYDEFDKVVTNKYATGGQDCDGAHRSGGEAYCKVDDLKHHSAYEYPEILVPNWKKEDEWNRDLRAEMAGY